MIHPETTLGHVNHAIGDGVFATSAIPKGTIVYVIDPLEIELSPGEFDGLRDPMRAIADKYSYINHKGSRILSWDLAKYVNHSCTPNTLSAGYGFEIALRDIDEGEEITDDYGMFNLEWTIDCRCGSSECRREITGSDMDRYANRWDDLIREALRYVRQVEQPLWDVMRPSTRTALKSYLDGAEEYRSVRALRFNGVESATAGTDRSS